jgi:hypothetical protein
MARDHPVILKTSILVVVAAAIVFAILSVGDPLVLFVNATASRFATSAPDTGQAMPVVQSTTGAQTLPPSASQAPTGNEIAAAFKTAYDSQTEIRQPPAEALFNQFQAWAAAKDARAQDGPVQPIQDTQAQVGQNPRPVPVQNARRVEVRPMKNARARVRREQNARAQIRP